MRKYEAMEALKVSFNAREQVAAACGLYETTKGDKYTNVYNDAGTCLWIFDGSKWISEYFNHSYVEGDTSDDEIAPIVMSARYQN